MKVGVLVAAMSLVASASALAVTPSMVPHRQAQEVIIPPNVTLASLHAKPAEWAIPPAVVKVKPDEWAIPPASVKVKPDEWAIPPAKVKVTPDEWAIPPALKSK
jgi:hypothetical protein